MSIKLFHQFLIRFFKGHLYGTVLVHISPPSPSNYTSNVISSAHFVLFKIQDLFCHNNHLDADTHRNGAISSSVKQD